MARKRVAVIGQHRSPANSILFEALSRLLPVDFLFETGGTPDAVLLFGESARAESSLYQDIPVFTVTTRLSRRCNGALLEFSADQYNHAWFRGATLCDPSIESLSEVPLGNGRCLVRVDGKCVWAVEEHGQALRYAVGVELPVCSQKDLPFKHFQPKDWFRLLPLLDFFKRITRDVTFDPPVRRAAFVFDDPNLHTATYGFLNYQELARHAKLHGYHVAIATVPLDARFTSRRATEIFRLNPLQLSLLIHGNNHTKAELAHGDDGRLDAVCAQALARIERFEGKTGLVVDRIMVPPHGACAATARGAIARLDFDGLCVSAGSLLHWDASLGGLNPHIGLGPMPLTPETIPILPRFGFGPDASMMVRLTAFLDQPVICRGHHQDCAWGLEPLAELAEQINGFDDVIWGRLSTILQRNYLRRTLGDTLYVKPLARSLRITIPEGIANVCIDWPGEVIIHSLQSPCGQPAEVQVELPREAILDRAKLPVPRFRSWLYARRGLCEVRDRLTPILHRFANRPKSRLGLW